MINRRQFLVQLGGATALVTVVGSGLSAWLAASRTADAIGASAPIAVNPVKPGDFAAPGTRAELTSLAQHYRIDINVGSGPAIDGSTFKLDIKGLVDNSTPITLDDLRTKFDKVEQIITMSCISNTVGGDLISTIKWTGLSMQDLVKAVRPMPEATHIRINGADGFSEIVALDVIREDRSVMLAYDWEDQPLLQKHGFPLRIHIPNRYGMKQPKWITSMEFIDKWQPGYWR
jgi:DMSO/TMAO reductase YedYZ molybdopterin-dependent catalytic subunit